MSKDVVHATKNKPALNKRQLSVVQQHQKKQRIILLTGIIVIACAVILTGYGVYDSQFKQWGEDILKINNTQLTMKQYVARARYILQSQGITEPRKNTSLASLLPQITDAITDDELMAQAAATEYQITITDDLVTEQIKKEVLPVSETEETQTGDFDSLYQQRLEQYQITDAEYREMTRIKLMETTLVQDHLNTEVPDTAAQVHVHLITVASEDDAIEVKQRLDDGEDFATVAMEKSTSDAESGGDLGWYAHDALSSDFADVIFDLDAGEVSEPVINSNATAYYIFKVSEKEDMRPLDENNLSALRSQYLQEWLKQRKYSSVIDNRFTSDKYIWVTEHI